MAKIGTAHVEIKPVLNEEALDAIVKRIEDAVEAGVARGLAAANRRANRPGITVWQDGQAMRYEGTE